MTPRKKRTQEEVLASFAQREAQAKANLPVEDPPEDLLSDEAVIDAYLVEVFLAAKD